MVEEFVPSHSYGGILGIRHLEGDQFLTRSADTYGNSGNVYSVVRSTQIMKDALTGYLGLEGLPSLLPQATESEITAALLTIADQFHYNAPAIYNLSLGERGMAWIRPTPPTESSFGVDIKGGPGRGLGTFLVYEIDGRLRRHLFVHSLNTVETVEVEAEIFESLTDHVDLAAQEHSIARAPL